MPTDTGTNNPTDPTKKEVPISALPLAEDVVKETVTVVVHQGVTKKVTLRQIVALTTKDDVGLGSVDNTPDADKPISTKQQQALDNKADKTHNHEISDVNGLEDALANKANKRHGHLIADVDGLQEALDARPITSEVQTMIDTAITGGTPIDNTFVRNTVNEW